MSLAERFWKKVAVGRHCDCWEWLAFKNPKGYGMVKDADGDSRPAHRVAYRLAVGPIPDKMHVLHRCDNPSCVNPSHLFLGTNFDNVADRVAKGRSGALRGEGSPVSKLTADQVSDIRARYGGKRGEIIALATEFGVDRTNIAYILKRKTWRHI